MCPHSVLCYGNSNDGCVQPVTKSSCNWRVFFRSLTFISDSCAQGTEFYFLLLWSTSFFCIHSLWERSVWVTPSLYFPPLISHWCSLEWWIEIPTAVLINSEIQEFKPLSLGIIWCTAAPLISFPSSPALVKVIRPHQTEAEKQSQHTSINCISLTGH